MAEWIDKEAPKSCDLCGVKIKDKFIDGKILQSCWAFLCVDCHSEFGDGLGTGKGQVFEKIKDRFVKTRG